MIKTTGSVYGCGNNYFGSLGDGTSVDRSSPTQITALGNEVAQMAGGFGHSLALKSDGSVMTFGENTYGQLVCVLALHCAPIYDSSNFSSHLPSARKSSINL